MLQYISIRVFGTFNFGTGSFGCTRSWHNVLVRLRVVLIPKWSGFFEWPLRYSLRTYGIVVEW